MANISTPIILAICSVLLFESVVFGQNEEEIRQEYLEELILLQRPHPDPEERPRNIGSSFVRLGYYDVTWQDWIERTGELPPDFDALPSIPFLPDPLIIDEGGENIPVETRSQWDEKRAWIKQQVKKLSSIAPRHLMVISPKLDRHADPDHVIRSMEQADTVYSLFNASENLEFKMPHQFNRFTSTQHSEIVNWLDEISK